MEDDVFKIIHQSSGPQTIERRASLTSKLIGNAKEWIHGLNQRYPERPEDIYARSYSSGDAFDGYSDLMFGRQRSKSITGENPVKPSCREAIIPGPLF